MATISFSGLGSGLNINDLVTQLVAAERKPTETRINSSASKINSQLSALSTVKGALGNVQSALEKLTGSADAPAFKTTVQDKAGFTATADSKVAPGRYEVEVLALAKTHKLSSTAFAKDAVIGSGTLTFSAGDKDYTVEIPDGAKLADIASAINKASGGKGVTASVVNADDGQHLVLSATASGTANALKVSASGGDGGLAALTYDPQGSSAMQQTVVAADARVKVDGFLRTSDSNTVTDLVPGLTLNLTEAKVNEKFSVTVAADNSALKANLTSLVSMYNAANTVLRSVSAYNAETKSAAALTGDSMVRGMQSQLRSALGANAAALKELGVTIAKDGSLAVDTSKLDGVIATDPGAVSRLFGKDGALGSTMTAQLKSVLDSTSGTLTQRTSSLNKRITDLSGQMDALDRRMEAVEARYTKQFIAMDTLVGQMQNTSSYLSQQLSALQTNKK